jgi:hypothetical protein
MTTDLALAIHARNARFRAWAQSGVPMKGGWVLCEDERANLVLDCLACGYRYRRTAQVGALEASERVALSNLYMSGRRAHCPHFQPLLGLDPSEVQALTALELLSTG